MLFRRVKQGGFVLMRHGTICALAALVLCQATIPASAGNCLSRNEGFELISDTVHWAFSIRGGTDCLQGLRGRAMLINEVKIIEPPAAGTLTIAGPAFFYRAPANGSSDRFKLQVAGENNRMRGTSVIVVDVSIR